MSNGDESTVYHDPEASQRDHEDKPQESPSESADEKESDSSKKTVNGSNKTIKFARTPGEASKGHIIDFGTPEGNKFYKEATKPLDSLHDLSATNLRDFIGLLEHRAEVYDWTTINEFEDPEDNERILSLFTDYGLLTLRYIQKFAKGYEGKTNRATQDSQMMADCIIRSLTVQARQTVTLYKQEYTINHVRSGPCMLKVIIRESHIDTHATTRIIRDKLQTLDTYIVSIDSDIVKFNEHVKDLMQQLAARGETTYDLLSYIFKAYEQVNDKVFVTYIERFKDKFDEGEYIGTNYLMQVAQNKYKLLKEEGKWNAPSSEEEELVALCAEVQNLKILKANKVKSEGPPKGKQGKGKEKKKYGVPKKPRKPSWMYIPPKPNESHTKTVGDKEWHWCPKHECWVRHLPNKCEGKGYVPNKRKNRNEGQQTRQTEEPQPEQEPPNKKVKMAEALLAYLQE